MSFTTPSLTVGEASDLGSVKGSFDQWLDGLNVELRNNSNDYFLIRDSLVEDLVEYELMLLDVLGEVHFISKQNERRKQTTEYQSSNILL